MIYKVTGRLREEAASEFQTKLLDGTIARQRPDGQEIVDSMNRAVVKSNGEIEWSQACFCDTPLAHERATIYDNYFDDLDTEVIDDYESYEGRPFMEHLTALVRQSA